MQYTHHIKGLNTLCSMFNSLVTNLGMSSNTVAVYKQQAEALANTQGTGISKKEISIMERLIGMSNTDNVKWSIAAKKIKSIYNSNECSSQL